jgi:hypothetical protein
MLEQLIKIENMLKFDICFIMKNQQDKLLMRGKG